MACHLCGFQHLTRHTCAVAGHLYYLPVKLCASCWCEVIDAAIKEARRAGRELPGAELQPPPPPK